MASHLSTIQIRESREPLPFQLVKIAAGEDANAAGGEETRADGVEVDAAIAHGAAIGLDGHFVAPCAAGAVLSRVGSGGREAAADRESITTE